MEVSRLGVRSGYEGMSRGCKIPDCAAMFGDGKRRAQSDARLTERAPCPCVQFHGKQLALQLRLPVLQPPHTLIPASGSNLRRLGTITRREYVEQQQAGRFS